MSDTHPTPPPPERRRFLKWAVHGLGALFGAVIGVPAVAYLIDARNRKARQSDFKPARSGGQVIRLNDLEKDKPQQGVILDVRHDAWTLHPNDVIGRVWLVRGEGQKVEIFTTICPHLGCSINYHEEVSHFVCPCHNGTFNLAGEKVQPSTGSENPAPRSMDSLEYQLVKDPASTEEKPDFFIEVKYQNFAQGKHDKILKG